MGRFGVFCFVFFSWFESLSVHSFVHSFIWKAVCHPDSKARKQQGWAGGSQGLALARRVVALWERLHPYPAAPGLNWEGAGSSCLYLRDLSMFVYLICWYLEKDGGYARVVSTQFLCIFPYNTWSFQISGGYNISI